MKRCTKCGEEKALFEFSKNTKSRDGLQHHCKACKLAYQKANPRRAESIKKYYEKNREACIARSVESVAKKREYYNQKKREWFSINRDRLLEKRREYYRQNSGADIERVRRRAKRINGSNFGNEAHRAEIDGLYRFCQIFKGFEVDHTIPLNGKTVSGLHIACNLQVLPVAENRRKGNKFTE